MPGCAGETISRRDLKRARRHRASRTDKLDSGKVIDSDASAIYVRHRRCRTVEKDFTITLSFLELSYSREFATFIFQSKTVYLFFNRELRKLAYASIAFLE